MSSPKSDSELLTRTGGLARQAFIRKKADMSPSGTFKLQSRSNIIEVWNRTGALCDRFDLAPDLLVSIVFSYPRSSEAEKMALMPNALCGPFAVRCVLNYFGIEGVVVNKSGEITDKEVLMVREKVAGLTKLDFTKAIDPTEPSPDVPQQGDFYRFWSSIRELNAEMYRTSVTMDPRFNKRLFTMENGFHTLAAKSILSAEIPELRKPLWPAYADSLLVDLKQWRILQSLNREKNCDPRIRLFMGWVKLFRRDLHGK